MRAQNLLVRYAIFALVATVANLAVQRLVLTGAGAGILPGIGHRIEGYVPALLGGTGAGLALKYVLDKRWIFFDRSAGLLGHGRKFALYTLTGVATTLIFWGTETAFWLAWRSDLTREAGAVLGLTVGYVLKYRLDRRFVFGSNLAQARPVG